MKCSFLILLVYVNFYINMYKNQNTFCFVLFAVVLISESSDICVSDKSKFLYFLSLLSYSLFLIIHNLTLPFFFIKSFLEIKDF